MLFHTLPRLLDHLSLCGVELRRLQDEKVFVTIAAVTSPATESTFTQRLLLVLARVRVTSGAESDLGRDSTAHLGESAATEQESLEPMIGLLLVLRPLSEKTRRKASARAPRRKVLAIAVLTQTESAWRASNARVAHAHEGAEIVPCDKTNETGETAEIAYYENEYGPDLVPCGLGHGHVQQLWNFDVTDNSRQQTRTSRHVQNCRLTCSSKNFSLTSTRCFPGYPTKASNPPIPTRT